MDTRAIQAAVVRADMFIVGLAKYGRIAITALLTAALWFAWIKFLKYKGWYN